MIVDTSVILAILFKETHGNWAKEILKQHSADLSMSTVNLTEVLILVKDQRPDVYNKTWEMLDQLPLYYVSPTRQHAIIAAQARLDYKSLNFGDCFAYALAKSEKSPIITLDSDFKKTDLIVIFP